MMESLIWGVTVASRGGAVANDVALATFANAESARSDHAVHPSPVLARNKLPREFGLLLVHRLTPSIRSASATRGDTQSSAAPL